MKSCGSQEPRIMEMMSGVIPGQERGSSSGQNIQQMKERVQPLRNHFILDSHNQINRFKSLVPSLTTSAPTEPATRPVSNPWFTHLLLHNKPPPNSVALNNSSSSCLTVLELTELCQAFSPSDFLIPHASRIPPTRQVVNGAGVI